MLTTDPAYFETIKTLQQVADATSVDCLCPKCRTPHDLAQRRTVQDWDDDRPHTECPECGAHSYYDLTTLRAL